MGTNKRVSSEKKNLVLHLVHNRRRRQRDIALDLRISKSTVEKIVARHKRAMQGLAAWPTVLGAPRVLSSMDLAFIIGFLERTPDAYLYEIQSELWNFCGVEASLSTIWEALKFLGYTRKRVRHTLFLFLALNFCRFLPSRRSGTKMDNVIIKYTWHKPTALTSSFLLMRLLAIGTHPSLVWPGHGRENGRGGTTYI
ncbi:hypothetical protein K438DRAFT_1626412 [Mycena galopus ATCC 62051]|nr:hypothetical protein K438DRAFT_1626412 [Mycena galopus ATCC 62051]